jgi:hypothetical protein
VSGLRERLAGEDHLVSGDGDTGRDGVASIGSCLQLLVCGGEGDDQHV